MGILNNLQGRAVPHMSQPAVWQARGKKAAADGLLRGSMHAQEAQAAHLQKELSDGLLCAVINNNTRCYNESTEFADHLDDALAGPYKVRASCSL